MQWIESGKKNSGNRPGVKSHHLPREYMSRWQGLMTPSSITSALLIHNTAHFQLHITSTLTPCQDAMGHATTVWPMLAEENRDREVSALWLGGGWVNGWLQADRLSTHNQRATGPWHSGVKDDGGRPENSWIWSSQWDLSKIGSSGWQVHLVWKWEWCKIQSGWTV